ncbi:MAG: protein-glutamine glutaminase family protein [Dermatophilaceae bacterium]|nr:hypothetical protein [Intrasporangiaceae bacterium]
MPDHDPTGNDSQRPDVIVGMVSAVPESGGAAAAGRQATEVTFGDGRRVRVDAGDRRASGWLAVLETLRSAGLPAYVEVEAGTDRVREVLVPVAVYVGELRDEGESTEVELIVSHARHRLLRADPRYTELRGRLERARADAAPVLVTERLTDHVIIDVRSLPEAVRPPPSPAEALPEPARPEAVPPVSMAVANQMFTMANGRTCCSAAPAAPCIPFTYPDDGCWGRAHEMCRLMGLQGVASDKVWIYGNLSVSSSNKPNCLVQWGWHVAPTLPVTVGGSTVTYVIDPSLFTSPVPQVTWKGVQGDASATLVPTASNVYHRSHGGSVTYDPTYALTNQVLATYRAQLQARSTSLGPPPYAACQTRAPGTQWLGTLAPNETRRWFTFGWPAPWHIVWTVMPTSICPGAPQLRWTTAVERANATQVTYWITVTNLTPRTIRFEGRYDVLAR